MRASRRRRPAPADRRLCRQLLAAPGAAPCQDLAAARRSHAGAKAVPALADQARGLIGAFRHRDTRRAGRPFPAIVKITGRLDATRSVAGQACPIVTGLMMQAIAHVNARRPRSGRPRSAAALWCPDRGFRIPLAAPTGADGCIAGSPAMPWSRLVCVRDIGRVSGADFARTDSPARDRPPGRAHALSCHRDVSCS